MAPTGNFAAGPAEVAWAGGKLISVSSNPAAIAASASWMFRISNLHCR
jgi:hypothetical protein